MSRLTLSKAQADLPDVVSRTAKTKERPIPSRRGKDLAAVVPMEDLKLLERLNRDQQDLAEARKSIAERGRRVLLREFLREFGK